MPFMSTASREPHGQLYELTLCTWKSSFTGENKGPNQGARPAPNPPTAEPGPPSLILLLLSEPETGPEETVGAEEVGNGAITCPGLRALLKTRAEKS